MDNIKAAELEATLKGKSIGGWKIINLINNGKSAAVFRATDGSKTVALKIFDDELIEKYGDDTQIARIDRELTLIGHNHPNMVGILGGGVDPNSNNHYIVMDYLDGPNLKQCLQCVPIENVGNLIQQLASCAEFIESLGLVHRDIKPENIAVLENYSKLVLLDFGVLRPIGQPGLTDGDGIQWFIGTLQYSSPEFLLRQEEDTVQGWRALTFYQLGGVLHDLVMRKPLFSEQSQPYARLVNAVQRDVPQIQNSAVPGYLIDLARMALAKDPKLRTELLNWASFAPPIDDKNDVQLAKQRVANRSILTQSQLAPTGTASANAALLAAVVNAIKVQARAIRAADNNSLPPLIVTRHENTVQIRFRESVPFRLTDGMTIRLSIEILDPAIGAIEIGAVAYTGREAPEAVTDTRILQGIYSNDTLGTALSACIYTAVDQGQQMDGDSPGGVISLSGLNGGEL
jgi:serine/threonine protein kinase